jgi:hypothetical protein
VKLCAGRVALVLQESSKPDMSVVYKGVRYCTLMDIARLKNIDYFKLNRRIISFVSQGIPHGVAVHNAVDILMKPDRDKVRIFLEANE